METKNIKSLLNDLSEEEIPSSLNLWPAIQSRIDLTVPKSGAASLKPSRRFLVIPVVTVVFALVLVFVLIGLTPQGRALADTVIKFFTTTDQLSFPVPTLEPPNSSIDSESYMLELVPVEPASTSGETPVASDQSCEGAALLTYKCRIESAEAKAGFDAWEFPADPQGVAFQSVEANSSQREIKITYEVIGGGGWIDLRQGIGEISGGLWARVPAEAVQAVLIGELPGEYVQGIFTSDGSGEATWNPAAAKLRLRWQDGERWFSLEKNGNPVRIEYLGKEEMIALAASLVDRQGQNGSQLRADYLTSITDAEILSGINLMEPTLLPEGFTFSFAQYDAQDHSIRLEYKLEDQPDDAKLIITERSLETAEQFEEGYYEEEGYQTLSWKTIDLQLSISLICSQEYGGRLSEAKMNAIAESMR